MTGSGVHSVSQIDLLDNAIFCPGTQVAIRDATGTTECYTATTHNGAYPGRDNLGVRQPESANVQPLASFWSIMSFQILNTSDVNVTCTEYVGMMSYGRSILDSFLETPTHTASATQSEETPTSAGFAQIWPMKGLI